ncbi:MAG: amidohydrolase, partial [Pseudomonadota bacterium]
MRKTSWILLLIWSMSTNLSMAESWAFVGVNVIPMDEAKVLKQHTVLVEDGVITGVGPVGSVPLPAGVRRIEGEDRYLMPGLAEMHAHVPQPAQGSDFQEQVLALFAVNGITTIRSMLGHPQHLELRETINSGAHPLAPRVFLSGPSFNGNSIDGVEDARAMVEDQKNQGYDFLKLHPGLTLEEFDAMAEQAQASGMVIAGHVPLDVGLARALEVRLSSIDHLDGYMQAVLNVPEGETAPDTFFGVFASPFADIEKIINIATQTAEAGVWNVPTQSLIENVFSTEDPEVLAAWPEMRYMPAGTVLNWANSKRSLLSDPRFSASVSQQTIFVRQVLIKALHDAGAGLLLGSDAPQVFNVPGFA